MKQMGITSKRIIYSVFLLIVIVTVGIVAVQRYRAEEANSEIEIVLNYKQLSELALQSDQKIDWWLARFAGMGVNSAALIEENLQEYMDKHFIYYDLTGNIVNDLMRVENLSTEIVDELKTRDAYDLFISTEDDQLFDRLVEGVSRYNSLEIKIFRDGMNVLIIDRAKEDLIFKSSYKFALPESETMTIFSKNIGVDILELPVGFDEESIALINAAGLDVLLRPINNSRFASDMIDNYQKEVEKYSYASPVPLLLTSGGEILGYESSTLDYVDDTLELAQANGYSMALIESSIQRSYKPTDGLQNLVPFYEGNDFVRVFTIWSYIQERYVYSNYSHGEEVGNAMYRAITERNIRVIYFNPFKWNKDDYVTNIDDYETVFKDLTSRLAKHGYTIGQFSVLEDIPINNALRIGLYIQILLFGLILINEGLIQLKARWNIILVVLAGAGGLGAHVLSPNTSIKLFAFIASVVFATLAGVIYYRYYLTREEIKGKLINGIKAFIISSCIALLGGFYVGSVMTRKDYLLELQFFTGVKLSLLLPIALIILFVVIAYIKEKIKHSNQNIFVGVKNEMLALLKEPIQVKHLIILGIVAVIGYIYLARSGNETNVQPMQIEIIFRNFLENVLLARPRNKEFLFAFPIIIIGTTLKAYYGRMMIEVKYITYAGIMGSGALGFTSITNTFSHIRTPLYMSTIRTLISFGASIVVALILLVGLYILKVILMRIVRLIKDKKQISS